MTTLESIVGGIIADANCRLEPELTTAARWIAEARAERDDARERVAELERSIARGGEALSEARDACDNTLEQLEGFRRELRTFHDSLHNGSGYSAEGIKAYIARILGEQ